MSGYTPAEKREWLAQHARDRLLGMTDGLIVILYDAWWRTYQASVVDAPRVNGLNRTGDIRKAGLEADDAVLAILANERENN